MKMIKNTMVQFICIFIPATILVALFGALFHITLDEWQKPLAVIGFIIYGISTFIYLAQERTYRN